ncbi:MAG: hypothetical protein P9M13_04150 [Candidatus Ancaeobacter aquaticus]|nr:hypothetical protein [Candidatus Ancaeobacter aquaticus]
MKKYIGGVVVGMIVCGISVFVLMPRLMIVVKESNYTVDETVKRLKEKQCGAICGKVNYERE